MSLNHGCRHLSDSADDERFVDRVERLISGCTRLHRPPEVRVFKIDNWFGHKWLGFSGKVVGALGIWQSTLTLPPFVQNRIAGQNYFIRDAGKEEYCLQPTAATIHHVGPSPQNLQRRVEQLTPRTALFWYSGNTAATGRGCCMAYVPIEDDWWEWYASWIRKQAWKFDRLRNIHEYEFEAFERDDEPFGENSH